MSRLFQGIVQKLRGSSGPSSVDFTKKRTEPDTLNGPLDLDSLPPNVLVDVLAKLTVRERLKLAQVLSSCTLQNENENVSLDDNILFQPLIALNCISESLPSLLHPSQSSPAIYRLTSDPGFIYPGCLGVCYISIRHTHPRSSVRSSSLSPSTLPYGMPDDDHDVLYLELAPSDAKEMTAVECARFVLPRVMAFSALVIESHIGSDTPFDLLHMLLRPFVQHKTWKGAVHLRSASDSFRYHDSVPSLLLPLAQRGCALHLSVPEERYLKHNQAYIDALAMLPPSSIVSLYAARGGDSLQEENILSALLPTLPNLRALSFPRVLCPAYLSSPNVSTSLQSLSVSLLAMQNCCRGQPLVSFFATFPDLPSLTSFQLVLNNDQRTHRLFDQFTSQLQLESTRAIELPKLPSISSLILRTDEVPLPIVFDRFPFGIFPALTRLEIERIHDVHFLNPAHININLSPLLPLSRLTKLRLAVAFHRHPPWCIGKAQGDEPDQDPYDFTDAEFKKAPRAPFALHFTATSTLSSPSVDRDPLEVQVHRRFPFLRRAASGERPRLTVRMNNADALQDRSNRVLITFDCSRTRACAGGSRRRSHKNQRAGQLGSEIQESESDACCECACMAACVHVGGDPVVDGPWEPGPFWHTRMILV